MTFSDVPGLVLALTGILPLAAILRSHRTARRPILRAARRPFRVVPPEIPLLLAGVLFLVYALASSGVRAEASSTGLRAALLFTLLAAGGLAAALASRLFLRPRGAVLRQACLGLLAFWAVFPLILMTFLVSRLFGPEQADVDVFRKREAGWPWLAALAFLAAPLLEEVCFRGLLYPALRQRLPVRWAILVTSVAFAAVHPPTVWLPLAIFAAALAWLVEATGSVLPAIVAHMALNGLTVATVLLGV